MKNLLKSIQLSVLLCSLSFFLQNCSQGKSEKASANNNAVASNATEEFYGPEDFAKIKKFNSHVHIKLYDTIFINQAAKDNFRFLNINVASPSSPPVAQQQEVALRLVKDKPNDILYATTFSLEGFNQPDWQQKTLAYLKDSFAKGAIAVKVWKNIGLELKDANGKFVMIDDPKFDPIIDLIEKSNITLIGHLAEPRNAWLPVDKMTVAGDKKYFSEHPQYHMYLHPEYPSHEEIIRARDHMLEKHPNVRFVGAHLASLEWDVNELAKRLDKYPNMAVDLAERISHFQYQAVTDWQKVHDFFIKYQDRLIYATDEGVTGAKSPEQVSIDAHANWLRHWKFFTSGEKMKTPKVEKEFNGLHLPREVVDKIYLHNAEKWFPSIKQAS
ncbi:hydrolase [Adhaeribacter arboris]|uniref:Hydrolase n=1 Tax=Adhaeribacter arboris TaxID=2072846 RepID=A0A2T2YL58_9BACT|nr:amidohydrolase family protein [Adhaeribacter arboris]PSR56241.1 hydrolase [Adhaeribacter arboris]